MSNTYNISALVLARRPYRENDQLAILFSRELGKIELVARGAKKTGSKLAAHLEPFNLSEIMVIKGRKFDYAGSIAGIRSYYGVKSSLLKILYAGKALSAASHALKPEQSEPRAFTLLLEYLDLLDALETSVRSRHDLLLAAFLLRFFSSLGYEPELASCLSCRNKIEQTENIFDWLKGGLVCPGCYSAIGEKSADKISSDCIKIIKFSLKYDLSSVARLRLEKKLIKEYIGITSTFIKIQAAK